MMNKWIPLIKKLVVFATIIALIYTLYPSILTEGANETDYIISDSATEEEQSALITAANLITPYHFGNKQSLSTNRLKQVTSDMALPSQYGEITITWDSSTELLVIEDSVIPFQVSSSTGPVELSIYRGIITQTPTVFQGAQAFELVATFRLNDVTLIKTYEGAIVPVMPEDFLGGFVYTFVRYASLFFEGVITTLGLSLIGTIIGFVIALTLVGLRLQKPDRRDSKTVKLLKKIGTKFSQLYVTIFRGTPMIVQASFFWYGLGLFGDPLLCGLFVVSLNTAAYIAEILRGSINAIDKGQGEAARSLGMSGIQSMMHVIFPQAVKNSMPAIGNEFVINIKDTAVLSVIGIFELFNQTTKVAGIHYRQLEAYLVVAVIYLFLTVSVTKLLQKVEKRFDIAIKELPSSN